MRFSADPAEMASAIDALDLCTSPVGEGVATAAGGKIRGASFDEDAADETGGREGRLAGGGSRTTGDDMPEGTMTGAATGVPVRALLMFATRR